MKRIKILAVFAMVALAAVCCADCGASDGYKTMDMKDAAEWMEKASQDYLLVDVRTAEEYENGHIPGALLVPIEDTKEGKVEALPDKDKTLLLYCRTGRRAEDSAKLLIELGYKDVYAIGGIFDWTGDVVTGPNAS